MTAQACEDFVNEMTDEAMRTDSGMGAILSGWVNAFLNDVDWQEIADGINEAYDLTDPDADEA